MKRISRALIAFLLLLGLLFVAESMMQPKVRMVPLEGVPIGTGAPDATFMLGALMDPPVATNPFLVIFSPIEGLTAKTRVVAGSMTGVSDSASIFVWESFGIQSVWHLDRPSQELRPLLIQSRQTPTHLCATIFPSLAAALRSPADLHIQKTDTGGVIALRKGSTSTQLEARPKENALWPAN